MDHDAIINQTIQFVKDTLKEAEGGHDWFHIERVYKNTLLIAKQEKVDVLIVSLGALLHDIADSKFHNGDETVGPRVAKSFLEHLKVDEYVIKHVIAIIENISFKGGNEPQKFKSLELDVVQDADRLDAIGAIGIARTFNYGGFKNRAIYNPEIKPELNLTKDAYKASTAPTINHFYEKLLRLKDKMKTKTGLELAQVRHNFMESYLKQFFNEWNGNN